METAKAALTNVLCDRVLGPDAFLHPMGIVRTPRARAWASDLIELVGSAQKVQLHRTTERIHALSVDLESAYDGMPLWPLSPQAHLIFPGQQ